MAEEVWQPPKHPGNETETEYNFTAPRHLLLNLETDPGGVFVVCVLVNQHYPARSSTQFDGLLSTHTNRQLNV